MEARMPQLNFVKSGQGPLVVLSHALGCDLSLWDEVAALLAPRYTVLRYDHRGHGASPPDPGPFSLEDLADDAAALIESQAGTPVHFIGLSLGGMVAQALAARHPQWVRSLVVAHSAASFDAAARALWAERSAAVRAQGMAPLVQAALDRWLTPGFRATPEGGRRADRLATVLAGTDAPSYAACCDAIAAMDLRETNPQIACPVLLVAGAHDVATPPAASKGIQNTLSWAQMVTLDTAHLGAVEQPRAFADNVHHFLQSLRGAGALSGG
jgi:3-oxoadipate enol-lactonase